MRVPSFWFLLWLGNADSPRDTEILKSPVNCLTLLPAAFCVRKKIFLGNLWGWSSVLCVCPWPSLWLWLSDESAGTLQGKLESLHAVTAVSPEVLGSLCLLSENLFYESRFWVSGGEALQPECRKMDTFLFTGWIMSPPYLTLEF